MFHGGLDLCPQAALPGYVPPQFKAPAFDLGPMLAKTKGGNPDPLVEEIARQKRLLDDFVRLKGELEPIISSVDGINANLDKIKLLIDRCLLLDKKADGIALLEKAKAADPKNAELIRQISRLDLSAATRTNVITQTGKGGHCIVKERKATIKRMKDHLLKEKETEQLKDVDEICATINDSMTEEQEDEILIMVKYTATASRLKILNKMIQYRPNKIKALTMLAKAYIYTGQYREADERLTAVLKNDPPNIHALDMRARLRLMTGDLAEALSTIDLALSYDNNDDILKETKAFILFAMGKRSDAIGILDKISGNKVLEKLEIGKFVILPRVEHKMHFMSVHISELGGTNDKMTICVQRPLDHRIYKKVGKRLFQVSVKENGSLKVIDSVRILCKEVVSG